MDKMKDKDIEQFHYIFWLCCYVVTIGFCLLAALIWVPVPKENQSMANLAMGFITATIIGVPLAYIFGGSPSPSAKKPTLPNPNTTAEFTASISTEPTEPTSQQ